MEFKIAETLLRNKMDEQGLKDWTCVFTNYSSHHFGSSFHLDKKIALDKRLVQLNSKGRVLEIIFHEIAHALLPVNEGHSKKWERLCFHFKIPARKYYSVENTVCI